MNNKEIIHLLQRRRHDELNELQMIKVYVEMNRYEQLSLKLSEISEAIKLEYRMFSLNIPQFSLFIIQYNYKHSNSRLTYDIHIKDENLSHVDEDLYLIGQFIETYINNLTCESQLFEFKISFTTNSANHIVVSFKVINMSKEQRNQLQLLLLESDFFINSYQMESGILIEQTIPKI